MLLAIVLFSSVVVAAGQECTLTERSPRQTGVPLSFCSMFLQDHCCDPTIDAEIAGFYTDLLGVSELCAAENSEAHIQLKYLFCFGCNPKQMEYTDAATETITVCPDMVRRVDPLNFEDCGLLLPGERGDICAGDDVVVPSLHYPGNSSLERGLAFITDPTGGAIPYFEDYNIEVCAADDEACMALCFDASGASRYISMSSSFIVIGTLFSVVALTKL